MKRSNLLVVAGGTLAAVAFFLPYLVLGNQGLFGQGTTLLNAVQNYAQSRNFPPDYQFGYLVEMVVILFEPIGALVLLASGLLAFKLGRAAFLWGLGSAAVNLTVALWYATYLYALDLAFRGPGDFGFYFHIFGIGYWLVVIGCALGLVGSLLGWLGQPGREQERDPQPVPPGGRALHISQGGLMVFIGGLLAAVTFFLPSFQDFTGGSSLLHAFTHPFDYLFLWPDLLAMLLLLGCGVLALTGRNWAYLGGLVGALVGLTLRLLALAIDPLASPDVLHLSLISAYWLMAIGCGLGLIGALLGLRERPGAPDLADDTLAAPAP